MKTFGVLVLITTFFLKAVQHTFDLTSFLFGIFIALVFSESLLFSFIRHLMSNEDVRKEEKNYSENLQSEFTSAPISNLPQTSQTSNVGKRVYGLEHRLLNLSISSTWLNMGYWKGTSNFSQACENLAMLLAESANIRCGDTILDVGYGCGDQDLFFWKTYLPSQIVGITSEDIQYQVAKAKIASENLETHIRLYVGNATQLDDIPDALKVFDKILALDCAYHFKTRETFLKLCLEKLTHEGKVSLADMILTKKPQGFLAKLFLRVFCKAGNIPYENMVDPQEYVAMLKRLGYVDIKMEYIENYVFMGLSDYIQQHKKSLQLFVPGYKWIKLDIMRYLLKVVDATHFLRFVIVTASKKHFVDR